MACIDDTNGETHRNKRSSLSMSSDIDLSGYGQICLPDLPPRYHNLQLPPNWYVPGKNQTKACGDKWP